MDLNTLADRAKDVQKAARLYLVDHIGNMTFPATPRYDGARDRWMVTILCETEKGSLPVGCMEFDGMGKLLNAPTAEQVEQVAAGMYQLTPVLVRGGREELEKAGFEVAAA